MLMRKRWIHKILLVAWSATLVIPAVFAANIYKYYDNQGNIVHGSQVPAEFVKNGYEVINEKGQVIQIVPRALTAEERAAQAEQLQAREQNEAERLRQEEADRLLLRLYRSPEEVVRRRDSTVEELNAQISALSGLLEGAEERVEVLQNRVESNINAGNAPPDALLAQVEDASEERDRLARQVSRIESEKAETIETARKNIDRLRELLNLN
jgi:chromosome segregation ATPase